MSRYIDLHCHWVAGVDDGARTPEEGLELLKQLGDAGFDHVVATPHMRPGMFDNDRPGLIAAFDAMQGLVQDGLPRLSLAAEHYFDDIIYQRILDGQALPYPGGHAILLEFYDLGFPQRIDALLAKLVRKGLTPVIAHPERYQELWDEPERLSELVELGAVALLDVAALVGKYGRKPKRCAEQLLEEDLYHAACTDAHRPGDVAQAEAGMEWIVQRYGQEEVESLFLHGPTEILTGKLRHDEAARAAQEAELQQEVLSKASEASASGDARVVTAPKGEPAVTSTSPTEGKLHALQEELRVALEKEGPERAAAVKRALAQVLEEGQEHAHQPPALTPTPISKKETP